MGCCIDNLEEQIATIEDVVSSFYEDYKIFTISRQRVGAAKYKTTIGLVVLPSKKNDELFKSLMRLSGSSANCIELIESTIDQRDAKMVDLFVLEVEISLV